MKYFSFLISVFLVIAFQAQFQFDNNIEKDNCRHGENVEYCRTHKVMNFFKLHSSLMKIYEEEQSGRKFPPKTSIYIEWRYCRIQLCFRKTYILIKIY